MKKTTLLQVIVIVILLIVLGVLIKLTINEINTSVPGRDRGEMENMGQMPIEEEEEEDTKAEDVEEGIIVTDTEIDLSKYSTNITIKKSGNYTLTGNLKNSVLVNADGEVKLNLNNVTIESSITAAISNISTNELSINLMDNTTNTLSDGGYSEYDGCIFSLGKLIIEGNGTLNVNGNQTEGEGIATQTNDITINGGKINIICNDDGINAGGDGGTITINDGEVYIKASGDGIDSNKNFVINGGKLYTIGSSLGGDAGIDTDGGFEINGGTLIALGSDMLESPTTTSKQKSVCFNLNEKVEEGSNISIKDENEEEIISFEANEDFKTLIVSNSEIGSGTYYLYQNGEKIK